MIPKHLIAQCAALEAETQFNAELRRQFRRKHTGDVRYRSETHDERTRAAAHAMHVACEEMRAAMRAVGRW